MKLSFDESGFDESGFYPSTGREKRDQSDGVEFSFVRWCSENVRVDGGHGAVRSWPVGRMIRTWEYRGVRVGELLRCPRAAGVAPTFVDSDEEPLCFVQVTQLRCHNLLMVLWWQTGELTAAPGCREYEQTIDEVWWWKWRQTLWTPLQLICRKSWMGRTI